MKVLLTSTSQLKQEGVKRGLQWLCKEGEEVEIETMDVGFLGLPNQPYLLHSVKACAHERTKAAVRKLEQEGRLDDFKMVISVENGIIEMEEVEFSIIEYVDACICHIRLHCGSELIEEGPIVFPCTLVTKEVMDSQECKLFRDDGEIIGYHKTAGQVIVQHRFASDPENWMRETHGVDRATQVFYAVERTLSFDHY